MVIKTASLTKQVRDVVLHRGTERPYSGEFNDFDDSGSYLCRQCGLALFRSKSKFHSGCGWASFEEEVNNHIDHIPDQDGMRLEILCSRCHAHLGHVFRGEGFTDKNTRHCVNSISLDFVNNLSVVDTEEAILAGGCFWGIEHLFKQLPGILKVEVGYSGGHIELPTYELVCRGDTGHYEAARVIYDASILNYEDVLRYFFEIHNFTQTNGQGPDIGDQYLSAIFYFDDNQNKIARAIINTLESKGYSVATKLLPATIFWRAEEYHQQYYQKTGKQPYCHFYQKRFDEK